MNLSCSNRKYSDDEPELSNVVMRTKTVILLENFSFGLRNLVSFIKRFLTFLFLVLRVNVFFTSMIQTGKDGDSGLPMGVRKIRRSRASSRGGHPILVLMTKKNSSE